MTVVTIELLTVAVRDFFYRDAQKGNSTKHAFSPSCVSTVVLKRFCRLAIDTYELSINNDLLQLV